MNETIDSTLQRNKRLLLAILLLALTAMLLCGCGKSKEVSYTSDLTFEEPILREAVEGYLLHHNVSRNDLKGITGVRFMMGLGNSAIGFTKDGEEVIVPVPSDGKEPPRIKSIEDLQYFEDLETVEGYISASIVTKLDFAKSLPHLKDFDVSGSVGSAFIIRGAGLEGIADCTELEHFSINVQNKTSLKDLANLKKLKEIALYGGYVKDVKYLTELTALEKITYIYLKDGDNVLPALDVMKNLAEINVANCKDISGLKSMHQLKKLGLWPSPEGVDLAPLRNLQGLEKLSIKGSYAEDTAKQNRATIDTLETIGVKVRVN